MCAAVVISTLRVNIPSDEVLVSTKDYYLQEKVGNY